ncbi:MAG: class I SAM-dependent methyltransferase [Opitutales bacterium]
MKLNKKDTHSITDLYAKRYKEYGYDPRTLGWFKGKQELRFSILTSQVDLEQKSILDVGCGFGDLNYFLKSRLKSYRYHGVDLVEELIFEAKKRHPEEGIHFSCEDFLAATPQQYDFILGSGIFNYRLSHEDNYQYIQKTLKKALDECTIGCAFDFLSDKVDFQKYEFTFHSNPSKILELAYALSRAVILRNDYAPFEFTLFLFKNDDFDPENTVFNRYQTLNPLNTIAEIAK